MRFFEVSLNMIRGALELVGVVGIEGTDDPNDPIQPMLMYEPDPGQSKHRERMGLLGTVACEPCLFAIFHTPPSDIRDLLEVHRRHLNFDHARRELNPRWSSTLWVILPRAPRLVMRGLGFVHIHNQPEGLYTAVPGLRLRMVVLEELEEMSKTLFLRLMGRRDVLARAVEEALGGSERRWERRIALPLLQARRQEILASPAERTQGDEDFLSGTRLLEGLKLSGEVPSVKG